jgi:mutator protein MutT
MSVAKVLIVDEQNRYLMMWRSDHPHFGEDPDLPGGTIEAGESPSLAAVREVEEEAGIIIQESDLILLYDGKEFSHHENEYSLYMVKMNPSPEIKLSWEHSKYEWLSRKAFLNKAKSANDTYMHMVHEVVSKHSATSDLL